MRWEEREVGVGAGNGRPLSRPVTSGGGRGRGEGVGERRVILKRDRYASLSRALFLLSRALSTIASFPFPSYFLLFPHSPPLVPYILGRSFHPLDLPVRLSATPSLHSGRIVSGRLCESVLEESLRIRMRKFVRVRARVSVYSAAQITRHISKADAAPSVFLPSDLTRRPRAEEALHSLIPLRLVNFVNFVERLSFIFFHPSPISSSTLSLSPRISFNMENCDKCNPLQNCKIWRHFANIILS